MNVGEIKYTYVQAKKPKKQSHFLLALQLEDFGVFKSASRHVDMELHLPSAIVSDYISVTLERKGYTTNKQEKCQHLCFNVTHPLLKIDRNQTCFMLI